MTKKTKKELERDLFRWKRLAIIFFVGLLLVGGIGTIFEQKYKYYQSQLQECQEDVDVQKSLYVLEVNCSEYDFYWVHIFEDSNIYDLTKSSYEDLGCKILHNIGDKRR